MPSYPIGDLRERLTVESFAPVPVSLSSLTRASTTATATTGAAHGYTTGDYVTVAGATPAGYNGKVKITVTGATTFTYPVNGALATPAIGTLTAVYDSDAQGGRKLAWATVAILPAALVPQSAAERLQAQAITAVVDTHFRVRVRAGITPKMRVRWTPSWPPSSAEQTLQIHGVLPIEDGRTWMFLECGRVA